MKNFLTITVFGIVAIAIAGCDKPRRNTGRAYMPDMYYSRAVETYSAMDTTKFTANSAEAGAKIFYNRLPVAGAVARGDMAAWPIKPDQGSDTTNYALAKFQKNPLDSVSIDMKEAERLYLVNCGICHGPKLDGNGPLYNGGNGPYAAKPATFVGDQKLETMAEGTMFQVVTYGIRAMGSYASQLSTKQRWMVIAYVKSKQAKKAAPAATVTTAAVTDSTAKK
jgi:mono/diheme cytochrome c family protein